MKGQSVTETAVSSEIRDTLEALNMTQSACAKALGVTMASVWRWASGRGVPSEEHLSDFRKLALAGGVERKKSQPDLEQQSDLEPVVEAKKVERRKLRPISDVEAVLMSSTAQITAAWISTSKFTPDPEDVAEFIRSTTRALRQE